MKINEITDEHPNNSSNFEATFKKLSGKIDHFRPIICLGLSVCHCDCQNNEKISFMR